MLLSTSKPLKAVNSPNKTTMCIINFFFEVNTIAKIEKITIGIPIIDGIRDVNDELDVTKLTNKPHNISNIPYKNEIDSILSLANLYSF